MVGGLRDVITCAEFQIEIFIGYDFTRGRIFDFPIDFSMGLTTVQRYCAACDRFIDSNENSEQRERERENTLLSNCKNTATNYKSIQSQLRQRSERMTV